jgi:uncharacterized repeat protein (TIGR01451 family)
VPNPIPNPVPTPVPNPIPVPQKTTSLAVNKLVKNLSNGDRNFANVANATPGDVMTFMIEVINNEANNSIGPITVRDMLPTGLTFYNDLKVDNNPIVGGNILNGLNIGSLGPRQKRIIFFNAVVAHSAQFPNGETRLTNTVTAQSGNASDSASAVVIVRKGQAPTNINTGLTDNILFDSFALPLAFAGLGIYLFRSRILKFEELVDASREGFRNYKAEKLLRNKISSIKSREEV